MYQQETVRVADSYRTALAPVHRPVPGGRAPPGCCRSSSTSKGDNLGSLNLYSRQAGVFGDESEHIGLLFAAHAAIAYSTVQQKTGLTRSVATRQLIGQAQGILMERHKLTADQAFALLVKASQHHNTKLRDIADHLVRSGSLPDSKPPTPHRPRAARSSGPRPQAQDGTAQPAHPAEFRTGGGLRSRRLLLKRRDLTCGRRPADATGCAAYTQQTGENARRRRTVRAHPDPRKCPPSPPGPPVNVGSTAPDSTRASHSRQLASEVLAQNPSTSISFSARR